MASPFQAITTGNKSISERVSAPLRAVKAERERRQEKAEGTYDALNIDYMGLPNNQIQFTQSWGDAVRENLVEGYRTNNQDMIREAKEQGKQLQGYITAIQQDYTIGRNSLKRAEAVQFRGLSNTKEEIELGFRNRYEEPFSFETNSKGYPTNLVIGGNPAGVNELVNNFRNNPFMVVEDVDFGSGYRAESIAERHASEVNVLSSSNAVRAKASEFAKDDLENDMVSNEDLAVLYAVRKKLISDINDPSESDVTRIQNIANDADKLEEAKNLYIQDYENFLVNGWETNEKARQRQQSIQEERAANKGILSLNPVISDGMSTYYMDVEGVDFNIKGNETVTSVAFDRNGNISKVTTRKSSTDPNSFNTSARILADVTYTGSNLTQEIRQLVKNRIETKAPNGFDRLKNKAIRQFGSGPNEEGAIDAFNQPAES